MNKDEKVVSYGAKKVGKAEKIPSTEWKEQILEPGVVYQFNFKAPELVWYKPWTIFYLWFNPEKYILNLRKEIAKKIEVSTEEIQILWFYYNGDTRKFSFQLRYVPKEEPAVAFAPVAILYIAILIASITGSVAVFQSIFTGKPVLEEILKFAKEAEEGAVNWLKALSTPLKYTAYITIGGGSIYLFSKLLSKKKAKKKAKI